jgi:hypothetical protein
MDVASSDESQHGQNLLDTSELPMCFWGIQKINLYICTLN